MAFVKKTWKDTICDHPTRRTLTDVTSGAVATYDVAKDLGTITTQGDKFNATTMNDLENRIKNATDNNETAILDIKGYTDYTISTTWVANTSIGDYDTYPYMQTISAYVYTTDHDCYILGATPSSMPSKEECDEFGKLCQFVDFSNGVTVLASEETTVALTLRVRGV